MSLKKKVILTFAALGATLCLFSNDAIATVTVNPAKPTNVIHLGGTPSKKATSKTSQTDKSKTKVIGPEDEEEQLSNTIVSKSSVRLNKNAPFL